MPENLFIPLLVAGITGALSGAVSWGAMRATVKQHSRLIAALHARVDGLMLALAQHGAIEAGAVEHLARYAQKDMQHERRR